MYDVYFAHIMVICAAYDYFSSQVEPTRNHNISLWLMYIYLTNVNLYAYVHKIMFSFFFVYAQQLCGLEMSLTYFNQTSAGFS